MSTSDKTVEMSSFQFIPSSIVSPRLLCMTNRRSLRLRSREHSQQPCRPAVRRGSKGHIGVAIQQPMPGLYTISSGIDIAKLGFHAPIDAQSASYAGRVSAAAPNSLLGCTSTATSTRSAVAKKPCARNQSSGFGVELRLPMRSHVPARAVRVGHRV